MYLRTGHRNTEHKGHRDRLSKQQKQKTKLKIYKDQPTVLGGDYMVIVHLIEGREFKSRDIGETADPVAEINVMHQKKHSYTHKKLKIKIKK